MFHALPVKPAFLGPPPTTTTLSLLPPPSAHASSSHLDSASPSTFTSPLTPAQLTPKVPPQDPTRCGLCAQPPKYTCPRCSLRTCSLPCSTAHKEKYSCTGIRRAEGFVSLREYGQGEWAEDYRYLEEGRRKIEGWGEGVKEEDLAGQSRAMGNQNNRPLPVQSTSGRGGAGGRGGGAVGRVRKSKTHNLQMELRARGVWTEYMPDGMGRRRMNQSGWNKQTGILSLTVQLQAPRSMLPEEDLEPSKPDISATIDAKTIYHPRVLVAHPAINLLPTLRSLLPTFRLSTDFVLLLPFFPSPARPAPPSSETTPSKPCRYFFPPLDADSPLAEVFKGTAWVEFPTVHIMSKEAWDKGLKDGTLGVVPLAQPRKRGADEMGGIAEGGTSQRWGQEQDSGWGARGAKAPKAAEPPMKRPKVAVPDLAKQALGALGAYASDDEEEEADVEEGGYMGMEASELNTGGNGGNEAGKGGIEEGEMADEDEDAVLDQQPGGPGPGSLLAGLPPDLLVAMSHAIDADLA